MLKYSRKHNSQKTYKVHKQTDSVVLTILQISCLSLIISSKIGTFFGIQRKMTSNLLSCILVRILQADLEQNTITRLIRSLIGYCIGYFFFLYTSLACSDKELPSDIIHHFRHSTGLQKSHVNRTTQLHKLRTKIKNTKGNKLNVASIRGVPDIWLLKLQAHCYHVYYHLFVCFILY